MSCLNRQEAFRAIRAAGTPDAISSEEIDRMRASEWPAAATLSVVLLAHHGFHEPLSSGWLVPPGFAAVALGIYAPVPEATRHGTGAPDEISTALAATYPPGR